MIIRIFITALFLAASLTAFAQQQQPDEDVSKARLQLGPDRWIQLHFFMQTGSTVTVEGEPDNNFYLSKCRLILNGQTAPSVFFFMQTDDINAGKSSAAPGETENTADGANKLFTQDAYINFKPHDAFQVYAGLLVLPFSRINMQSDATLMFTSKSREMSPFKNYSNNGRDTGVMLRSLLRTKSGKGADIRVGIFQGLDNGASGHSKRGLPRITGRIQGNLFEAEDGYFYSENYLAKKTILAFGLGIDFQPGVSYGGSEYKNSLSGVIDFAADVNQDGGKALALQGGFLYGANNPAEGYEGAASAFEDYYGGYFQVGMLLGGKIQPAVRATWRRNLEYNAGADYDILYTNIGLNYFINDHFASVKLDYQHPFMDIKDIKTERRVNLQAQIYM